MPTLAHLAALAADEFIMRLRQATAKSNSPRIDYL
jgi:hypothetical protein